VDPRWRPRLAVGLACLLLLLVGAERRLAEVHLNRVSSSLGFENEDLLDGDEIRVRLLFMAADDMEPVGAEAPLTWDSPPSLPSEAPPAPPTRWVSPRGPPLSHRDQ
jgi:hypothetical protein